MVSKVNKVHPVHKVNAVTKEEKVHQRALSAFKNTLRSLNKKLRLNFATIHTSSAAIITNPKTTIVGIKPEKVTFFCFANTTFKHFLTTTTTITSFLLS